MTRVRIPLEVWREVDRVRGGQGTGVSCVYLIRHGTQQGCVSGGPCSLVQRQVKSYRDCAKYNEMSEE